MTYSIIIPHKDIPDLLQRSLDSIPQREDIEIIVVDDASSVVPQITRGNVRLIPLPTNRGAGHARNIGLQQAQGKWILFLDADDFFLPNAFDTLDRYVDCDKDICLFYPNRYDCDTLEPSDILYPKNFFMDYYLGRIGKRMLLLNQMVPHGKMIRRQFFLDHPEITFPESLAAEDLLWNCKMAVNITSIEVIDAALYAFTIRPDSLTNNIPHDHMMSIYQQFVDMHDYLQEHHVPYPCHPHTKGMELARIIGGNAPQEMLAHIKATGKYEEYLKEQKQLNN